MFMFEYNADKDLTLVNYDKDVNGTLKLGDFLESTATEDKEEFLSEIGIFAIDWAMYNANYDFMVYNALVFSYMPNGGMITKLTTESFRATPEAH